MPPETPTGIQPPAPASEAPGAPAPSILSLKNQVDELRQEAQQVASSIGSPNGLSGEVAEQNQPASPDGLVATSIDTQENNGIPQPPSSEAPAPQVATTGEAQVKDPVSPTVDTQAHGSSASEPAPAAGEKTEESAADDAAPVVEQAAPKEGLGLDVKEWKLPERLAKDRNFLKIQLKLRSRVIQEGGVVDEAKLLQDAMREYYGERVESYLERSNGEITDEVLNDKIYARHYREIVEELVSRGKSVNKENLELIKKESLMRFLHEKDLKVMPLLLKILFGITIAVGFVAKDFGEKVVTPQQQAA